MFCNKCGKEIEKGKQYCEQCTEIKTIKSKSKKTKKIIIGIAVSLIVVGGVVGTSYFIKKSETAENENDKIEVLGNNNNLVNISELSFNNMKSSNEDLNINENQKEILKYFDNNYFSLDNAISIGEDLQRYPTIFNNAQVKVGVNILKTLKSTETEYEAIVYTSDGYGPAFTLENIGEDYDKYILRTNQLNERLIEGDNIVLKGKYVGIETIEVDGKSYTLPVIEAIDISTDNWLVYDIDTITDVSKTIFGENIKVRKAVYGEDTYDNLPYATVTLDNQANIDFKVFNICQSESYIEYNRLYNDIPNTIDKTLKVGADFEHYIISTYDRNLKKLYIDYYDRNYNKIWGEEFEYTENIGYREIPMDYTKTQMSFIVSNYLYCIDLETGNNVFEPVLVGNKLKTIMLEDSILLIGDKNKDTIMYVDYSGNIIKKLDVDTKIETISKVETQLVDGKMVIKLEGEGKLNEYNMSYISKYILLNNDKTIEISTEDRGNNSTLTSDNSEDTTKDTQENSTNKVFQLPMNIANMSSDTEIVELYLKGSDISNWGNNLLGNQILTNGLQLEVILNVLDFDWDMKIINDSGVTTEFTKLNLSEVSTDGGTITLKEGVYDKLIAVVE